MTGVLDFAMQLFNLVPMITQGIQGAQEALEWGVGRIKDMQSSGRDPTAEEWDELNSRTAGLRTALHSDDQ